MTPLDLTLNLTLEERLSTARIALLLRQPFFGNMATRMALIENNTWCKTAATDGMNFYYNRDFVDRLTIKELEFLFGHEILHAALDHIGRVGKRDRKISNIAQDYAVNQILVDDKIGSPIVNGMVTNKKGKLEPIGLLQDNKYRDMSWEEIYDKLLANATVINIGTLDQHLDQASLDDDDADGDGVPTLSESQLQEIRDNIKSAIVQASASAGLSQTPDIIKRMIGQFTAPTINWKELVRQEIQSVISNNFSFKRPNRRASSMGGIIMPCLIPTSAINVAIALDMSGSIGDEDANTFLSEVQGIVDQFPDYKIDIWCFDTSVMNFQTFSQHSGEPITNYKLVGGGGTDFDVNFKFMKENNLVPKKFIMFTDGYPGGSWGDKDYCDTIFVVKGNKQAKAPFGQTVIYEEV